MFLQPLLRGFVMLAFLVAIFIKKLLHFWYFESPNYSFVWVGGGGGGNGSGGRIFFNFFNIKKLILIFVYGVFNGKIYWLNSPDFVPIF